MKHLMYRLCTFTCFLGIAPITFAWWHYTEGFVWNSAEWWRWLFYETATNGMPPEFKYSFAVISVTLLTLGFIVLTVGVRSGAVTVSGGRSIGESHGSARFATRAEIKREGFFEKGEVVIGGYKGKPLYHSGPEHILCFAATRSGKGVGLVINSLLDWLGSTLVLDIKGENWTLTSGYRASLGHQIIKFEPTALSGSSRYNPLEEIRMGTDHEIADCQQIAMMVIDPEGKGLKDFWMQSGYEWLTGVILHVLYKVRRDQGRHANFADVLAFMSAAGGDYNPASANNGQAFDAGEQSDKKGGDESFVQLLDEMRSYNHGRDTVHLEVHKCASSMMIRASNERSGVHSSAKVPLALYADPIVSRNIATSDFQIDELMDSEQPVSLYVVIPPADFDRLQPLLRLFFNQIIQKLTREMEFEDGRTKARKHRLLLMLDEFPTLGKLDIMERGIAYIAGYGIKAFLITQDIEQLQKAYSKQESISKNCSIHISHKPNDLDTAKHLSDRCGETTVITKRISVSRGSGLGAAKTITESTGETGRKLMTPDEISGLRKIEERNGKVIPGEMLILGGKRPVLGEQYLYFQDKRRLAATQLAPVAHVISHDPQSHDSQSPDSQSPDSPSSSLPSNSTAKTSLRPAHGEQASTTHKGDNS